MEQAVRDAHYMARAVQLAKKGLYTTDPNPRVGCVLVKDGRIVGEGWHHQAGDGHAEVEALNNVTENPAAATAYVTLEPCSHHGRTPPCCETLVKAGITRVVAAMQDPNPLVSGRGLAYLTAHSIEVVCGILEQDARELNKGFIKRMTEQRPYVRSKLAMSLDGRTAMASGESQWITSPESRADVQKLRAQSSAILTGINTVLKDDPSLTARIDADVTQPIRVVLDSKLQMPPTAKMLNLHGRTLILTCCNDPAKIQLLQKEGADVHVLPEKQRMVDLNEAIKFLASQQVNEVMVEAGAILNGALLEANLVDEWIVYMAPKILGDEGRGLFHLPGLDTLADSKKMIFQSVRQVGNDLKVMLATEQFDEPR